MLLLIRRIYGSIEILFCGLFELYNPVVKEFSVREKTPILYFQIMFA